MALQLTDEQVKTLIELVPWVRSKPVAQQAELAFEGLVELEQARRGARDRVSGAYHLVALTQGSLLKEEHDLAIHAHTGWPVGVLTCDVREMIRFNQRFGFPAGDALLARVVQTLAATFPRAKIVRTHTDCFAVLLVPSSELEPTEALRAQAAGALAQLSETLERELGGEPYRLVFTLGLLELRIANPSHWQLLGPLVWAESERVHVLARSGQNEQVLRRRLDLDGAVQR